MRAILKGATDQSVVIRIIDSSDGTPETAVEHNTAGIDLWYRREGATKTSLTEAALVALDSAHADGGIEHIGDGYYRLDLPDAAVATGANGVVVGGTVTGMVVIGCYVHLVDYDPQNAVRLGLTALPNAAADAAGGLPISDAGGLDMDAILADTNDLQTRIPAALVGGRMDANVGAISADSVAADNAEAFFDGTGYAGTGNTIPTVTTLTNDPSGVTTLLSRVGTPANLGSGATVAANLTDIEGQTDDIGAAGAGLTAVPWNASWDAEVQSEVTDALEVTLSDSIPADGTLPSVKQALYMLVQFMTERSVSSTTVTIKKADGSTSLFTLLLNDATTPTSITRAS